MTRRAKYAILFIGFISLCLAVVLLVCFVSWVVGAVAAVIVVLTYARAAIEASGQEYAEIIDGANDYGRGANGKSGRVN